MLKKRSTKFLLWFIGGQVVQIICQAVSQGLWEYRQIPFCIAAGFLVCVAVFAGTCIREKPEQPKSYLEWAVEEESQDV